MAIVPQTLTFEDSCIRYATIENKNWFVARDVLSAIQCTTTVTTTINTIEHLIGKSHIKKEETETYNVNRNTQIIFFISEQGLTLILSRSRKRKAKAMSKMLDLKYCVTHSIESKNIQVILNSFKHLSPIEQFSVNNFLIDLYFPYNKIAVECDEKDHQGYSLTKQAERQKLITNKLGCQWVRFNPHQQDFCIGTVINKILQLIYLNH